MGSIVEEYQGQVQPLSPPRWVRLSSATTQPFYSIEASDSNTGRFRINGDVPNGTFTLSTGPSKQGPWTVEDSAFLVALNPPTLKGSQGVYNVVVDYAATGNGVTDDTAAFTSWLGGLKGVGGGTARLGAKGVIPPAAYSVGALTLQSAHGVWIEGQGAGGGTDYRSVLLQYNGAAGGVFITLDQVRWNIFGHFSLLNGTNTFAVGIDLDQSVASPAVITDDNEFVDIAIKGATTACVRIGHSQLGNSCDLMTFRRIGLDGNGNVADGFRFEWGSSTLHRFYDCSVGNCAVGFHMLLGRGSQAADIRAWGTNFESNTVDVQTDSAVVQSPIVFDGFYSENATRLFVSNALGARPSTVVFENGRWASDLLNADGKAIQYRSKGVLNLRNVDFTTNANGGLTTVAGFQIVCTQASSAGIAVDVSGCTFPNMAPFPSAGGAQQAVGAFLANQGYDGSNFTHIPNEIGALLGSASNQSSVPNFGLGGPLALTAKTVFAAATNLGANVTSVTPTGNDQGGLIAIVMAGALAANTRIATLTFGKSLGASTPRVIVLVNQTSGAGLANVQFYYTPSTGVSIDIFCNQALASGTYTVAYLAFAQALT